MLEDELVATARALSHPLKVKTIGHLARCEKASPSEMADVFGAPLGNVAYHVRQLHQLGVVAKAGQRPVRGAVEHYYRLSDEGARSLQGLMDGAFALLKPWYVRATRDVAAKAAA